VTRDHLGRAAAAPKPGSHARAVIAVAGPGPAQLELLAAFTDVIAALCPEPFSLTRLELDYVAPASIRGEVTYSAKVTRLEPAGAAAELSLLVFVGHRVCVRGRAGVAWSEPIPRGASRQEEAHAAHDAGAPGSGTPGRREMSQHG
jgi:hypothetical protein